MTAETASRSRLFLFDRPRLEIPLPAAESTGLPVWLAVGLPVPSAADRSSGRFLADPRVPESEIVLEWGTAPDGEQSLTVTVGGCHNWVLEQDAARPDRWRVRSEQDACRVWS